MYNKNIFTDDIREYLPRSLKVHHLILSTPKLCIFFILL